MRSYCCIDGGVANQGPALRRHGKAPDDATKSPNDVRAESAVHKAAPPIAVSANIPQPPHHGSDAIAKKDKIMSSHSELVTESRSSVGALSRSHSLMKESSSGSSSSSGFGSSLGSTNSLSLQERRQQQLKLINERLAKRHSNLPWKDTPTQDDLSTQAAGSAGKGVKKVPTQQSKGLKVAEFVPNKGSSFEAERKDIEMVKSVAAASGPPSSPIVSKTTPTEPTLSRELPSKSVAWKPSPVPDPNSAYPNEELQTGVFSTQDPLPKSIGDGALPSETSFLPVSPTSFAEQALSGNETTHEPETQDTDIYVNSLLSSLTSAYGYSSLAEKSRLLSSLVGSKKALSDDVTSVSTPPREDRSKEVIKIQSAYRGYLARKKCRQYSKDVKAATLIQAAW